MARSLLGTTGCANNDLPEPPTNAQWVASGNCEPANQESNCFTECQAACPPGFTASGSFSATCSCYEGDSVWAATATSLACKRPGCTGVPGSSPLPDNAAWSCGSSNAAVGSTCTAQCEPGYRQAGSWESTCTQQGWQAPTGTGVTCSLIVPDGPCSNSPGPSTDGMPANTQWACGQATLSGTTCQAACAPGYVNVARTTRTAACLDGLWQDPSGDMTCILGTDPCRQPPPLLWLPAGGEWDCTAPVSHAAACTASCEPGYNRTGAITAWCFNGNWVQPTTSITCTPAGCASNPKPQLDPDAVWTCQLPTAHGAACTAGCNGTNAPDPTTAICDFGTWVYSRGSCAGTASKIYYFNVQGLGHNMISLIEDIHSGAALTMANNVLMQRQKDFALYNPALSVLNISVQDAWISQSTSNTQRRRAASQRLLEHGGMDEVVVGVQVSLGQGFVAKTAEAVLDAAIVTPSAMSYLITLGQALARDKLVSEFCISQMSLAVSDSTGRPLGASAGRDSCLVQLMPNTPANSSAGIISAQHSSSKSKVTVCGGVDTLYATFEYIATSTAEGNSTLAARITGSNTTSCSVTPAVLPGNATGTVVVVTCQKDDGSAFTEAATAELLLTANFTCSGTQSITASTTNITTVPRPTITVRLGKQPQPGCGGKPAVAVFRYKVNGVQIGQDFEVTAQVGPSCTSKVTYHPSKSNGIVIVTCSGAFAPGVPVPVELNMTASPEGCGTVQGSAKADVSVLCCTTGSSYAKADSSSSSNRPTCFQHARPGATGEQCAKAPNASGYANQGPGSGKLFLAQKSNSCSDAVEVGSVNVTCPEGAAANRVHFKIATPAAFRSSERRYFVSCAAPTSSPACPGSPRWVSVKAKSAQPGLPEGYNSTTVNGVSTVEFNVTAGCSCSSVYHGMVDFAGYRNLPLSACGK